MHKLILIILFYAISALNYLYAGHQHISLIAGLTHLIWVVPLIIAVLLTLINLIKGVQ